MTPEDARGSLCSGAGRATLQPVAMSLARLGQQAALMKLARLLYLLGRAFGEENKPAPLSTAGAGYPMNAEMGSVMWVGGWRWPETAAT